jgi:hypothetical protein
MVGIVGVKTPTEPAVIFKDELTIRSLGSDVTETAGIGTLY